MAETKAIDSFVNQLANKYTAFYDVYRDEVLGNFTLPFLAIYKGRDERYMVSKKIKIYSVENQQLIFATVCNELNKEVVKQFQTTIEKNMFSYIPNHHEHMSTVVIGMLITNQKVDQSVIKEVRLFRKLKFLKFGFHGWIEMYLVMINLYDQTIHIHPKGRSFVSSLEKRLKEDEVKI